MALLNSLGPFEFAFFSRADNPAGTPELPRSRSEVIERSGVSGVGIQLTGRRGRPFDMLSRVDVDTYAAGVALAAQYEAAAGPTELAELIFNSVDYLAEFGVKYGILDAVPQEVKTIAGGRPIVSTYAGAWVVCRWSLIPIIEAE